MTKTISLSDDAYEELKKIKNGYTYSEIILRLIKKYKKDYNK